MRATRRLFRLVLPAASLALVLTMACQNSNSVTSPMTGPTTTSSANVAGDWSGAYRPNDTGRCAGSSASATFVQNGTNVTGIIRTADCGVAGSFKGHFEGSTLVGLIDTPGCVGGGVTGTFEAAQLRLSLGDMTKPLITGDTIIMTGGEVTLHK